MPTIAVSKEVKQKLNIIKNREGYRSVNEILDTLILLYEKTKFLKAAKIFQERLKERKLDIAELCSNSDFKLIVLGEK
ncbi:MAG: hypothetical protein ACTSRS_20175 [Candidatus Helarchaeota archaeon]